MLFFERLPAGETIVTYGRRAEVPGTYTALPAGLRHVLAGLRLEHAFGARGGGVGALLQKPLDGAGEGI